MRTIAIIGAGYSGTSLAINLHRFAKQPINILLFSKDGNFAEGAAYSTKNDVHLLNVTANHMSALADRPNHFVDWLRANPQYHHHFSDDIAIELQFAPRMVYANYLKNLLDNALNESEYGAKIHCISDEVTDYQQGVVTTKSQQQHQVDDMVLALGNPPPRDLLRDLDSPRYIKNPWQYQAIEQIATQDDVFIIGTGLTMVDVVLALQKQQHQGKIYALSRRGLAPRGHVIPTVKYALDGSVLPQDLNGLTQQCRQLIKQQHNDWRSVITAYRPFTQKTWRILSIKDKKRFMRHLVPYWDVHRHRIAPQVAEQIDSAQQRQQLHIISGRIQQVVAQNDKLTINYRARKDFSGELQQISAHHIINCTGPNCNYQQYQMPLLQSLYRQQLISNDEMKLGLAVDENNALLDQQGKAHKHLFALATLTKGAHWEIIAVPDISHQTLNLANKLLSRP